MAGIRQVGEREGIAQGAEEEEEAAGGDAPDLGVVPPQEETSNGKDGQQANDRLRRVEPVGGGNADEPGGAEGDEGH